MWVRETDGHSNHIPLHFLFLKTHLEWVLRGMGGNTRLKGIRRARNPSVGDMGGEEGTGGGIVTTFQSISYFTDTVGVSVSGMGGCTRLEMILWARVRPSGAKYSGHGTGFGGHDWASLHTTAFPSPEGIWHGSSQCGIEHRAGKYSLGR